MKEKRRLHNDIKWKRVKQKHFQNSDQIIYISHSETTGNNYLFVNVDIITVKLQISDYPAQKRNNISELNINFNLHVRFSKLNNYLRVF